MPFYDYACDACEKVWSVRKPMSEHDSPEACPECEGEARKVITGCGVIFKGDGWTSKNNRVAGQMAEKNRTLGAKQAERLRDGGVPGGKLVPNVGGERVESWSEAKKLAGSQGKDTSGYERMERKEQSLKKKPATST